MDNNSGFELNAVNQQDISVKKNKIMSNDQEVLKNKLKNY